MGPRVSSGRRPLGSRPLPMRAVRSGAGGVDTSSKAQMNQTSTCFSCVSPPKKPDSSSPTISRFPPCAIRFCSGSFTCARAARSEITYLRRTAAASLGWSVEIRVETHPRRPVHMNDRNGAASRRHKSFSNGSPLSETHPFGGVGSRVCPSAPATHRPPSRQ